MKDASKAADVWPRPLIVPLPESTEGVAEPILSLNGTWKLNPTPPPEFWSRDVDPASWDDMTVPGYTFTAGYKIERGDEYAYRRKITIPEGFAGKRIFLRFDGVTGQARVWIDGKYVRDHYGGFTTWYCEITDLVNPGEEAWLTVGVVDKPREISVFNLGGIIRDVRLLAVPADFLTRLHVATDLDDAYEDAVLNVAVAMDFTEAEESAVELTLIDPTGDNVSIEPATVTLTPDEPEVTLAIPVTAPQKWDAEHPHLYTLQADVLVDGVAVETLSRRFGFRVIEVEGNQVFVNGNEVKLRGVNRHDIYPPTGRAVTPELVEEDVRLFRDANINFIRTSHYPPRQDFLEFCDEYGIYVEDEIAVAFVYQSIQPTQNDPAFTADYMNQFTEMIERDRSHPCVIMWSLANESYWGRNFEKQFAYAKAADPSRPAIFSYPITQPEGTRDYDIWSLHYASWDEDPAKKSDNFDSGEAWGHDAPVIHDEFAHIPCYDTDEQMRDPAVRDFWGESINRWWESIFPRQGALGCAIWGSIDDVMITPESYTRWREWGIIDGWRRKKPEYWLTQKGYSPIRIPDESLENPGADRPLKIPIKNWFDHTNLSEIEVEWLVESGDEAGTMAGPNLAPHAEGVLEIPSRDWQDGELLVLKFYRAVNVPAGGRMLVDAFALPIGGLDKSFATPQGPAPAIAEDDKAITVSGADFEIIFSKEDGLVSLGTYKGQEVIKGGPHLNLIGGVILPAWELGELNAVTDDTEVVVTIHGSYGDVVVTFEVRIDGQGLITTIYTIDELPYAPPRNRRLTVGTSVGGYTEVGVAYTLTSAVNRLAWDRDGQWSVYPDDHIGRARGIAERTREGGDESYGTPPGWPWAEDMRNYPLFGSYDIGERGTKDFRSAKHNIYAAAALLTGSEVGLRAESDGADAVRVELLDRPGAKVDDRDPAVNFVGTWQPMDGDPKTYLETEMISNKAGDYVEFTFEGTGICWIGSKDLIFGKADVYVDGVKEVEGLDLFCGLRVPGTSRGEKKLYQEMLFSKEGLPEGEHTIKIVVTGEKDEDANNSYVPVDGFVVLGGRPDADVRFVINNAWNYPELTWGNYVKDPILIWSGYSNQVRARLTDAGV
jgi:hypothetical protein